MKILKKLLFFFTFLILIAKSEEITKLEFIIKSFEYQSSLVKSILIKTKLYTNLDNFNINLQNSQPDRIFIRAKKGTLEYEETIGRFKPKYGINKEHIEKKLWDKSSGVIKILGFSKYLDKDEIVTPPGYEGIITSDNNMVLKYQMFKGPDIGSEIIVFGLPLLIRLKEDKIKISSNPRNLEGHLCYLIEGECSPPFEGKKYEVWVDPEITFMPRLIKEIVSPGNYNIRKFLEYKEISKDVYFPMRVEVESVSEQEIKVSSNVSIPKIVRNLYIVETVEVNNTLKEEIFKFDFPKGTRVKDEIINKEFIIK